MPTVYLQPEAALCHHICCSLVNVCAVQFLSKERDDFEARFTRAQLYGLIREGWKAKGQFHHLLEKEPGHPEVSQPHANDTTLP